MSVAEEDRDDPSGPKKRLTDAEFAAAKELYELGKAGIAELADQYGCARQTLSRRFKEIGSIKGCRAHEVANAQSQAIKATAERFAERRAEWIEDTRLEAHKSLKQARMITQKIVLDEVKRTSSGGSGTSVAGIDDDLRALGRYNKILMENFAKSLEILRADEHTDEEDLPTLTVEDLTDQDILDHHISIGALDEDATVEDLNI
jgi:AraC-like DNA-binding protein